MSTFYYMTRQYLPLPQIPMHVFKKKTSILTLHRHVLSIKHHTISLANWLTQKTGDLTLQL